MASSSVSRKTRSNTSSCVGKRARTCGRTTGCKLASGKKRQFCRTKKNKKH